MARIERGGEKAFDRLPHTLLLKSTNAETAMKGIVYIEGQKV